MSEEPRKIVIRPATALDAVAILRLHTESHKEASADFGVPFPALDHNKMLAQIARVIALNGAFVAELPNRIVGSIGLEPQQLPFSTEWHLGNVWFDVLKTFRKHGTADGLLTAAERLAELQKLFLIIHFNSGMKAELKDRWVRQRGYAYCGGTLLRKTVSG